MNAAWTLPHPSYLDDQGGEGLESCGEMDTKNDCTNTAISTTSSVCINTDTDTDMDMELGSTAEGEGEVHRSYITQGG